LRSLRLFTADNLKRNRTVPTGSPVLVTLAMMSCRVGRRPRRGLVNSCALRLAPATVLRTDPISDPRRAARRTTIVKTGIAVRRFRGSVACDGVPDGTTADGVVEAEGTRVVK
jgi:hypothetical protein